MMQGLRRLYWGETHVNFVGRWRMWMLISAAMIIVSIAGLMFKGFNWSIEFTGGTKWTVPSKSFTTKDAQAVMTQFGIEGAVIQEASSPTGDRDVRIEAHRVKPSQVSQVTQGLADAAKVKADAIEKQSVGPSWGDQVSSKAVQAFVIFLILVLIYISLRFEFKMAVTAIAEMVHDLIITVGVYAIVGFVVSPATIIGILTMLGYSLYDAVVVFDKVRENSPLLATGKITYSELVNKSMNQTMMRSFATAFMSMLPAASLLFVGALFLGAVSLEDLALALFVGVAAGAYSSIFFASPVLAKWKETEPRYRKLKARAMAQRSSGKVAAPTRTRRAVEDPAGDSDTAFSAQRTVAPTGAESADEGPSTSGGTSAKKKPSGGRSHGRSTPKSRKKRH